MNKARVDEEERIFKTDKACCLVGEQMKLIQPHNYEQRKETGSGSVLGEQEEYMAPRLSHIEVDKDCGLVHTVKASSANIQDIAMYRIL